MQTTLAAMEEFVFGTKEKEAASLPTPPEEVVSPAPRPTASLTPFALLPTATPPPPFTLLSTATPPGPFASAPEPVRQSKESSLMSKLPAPDKEATVRFTVDMSETLHRKLSMLAAKRGLKKVDIVGMLLEDGLKEVDK